MKGPHYEPVNRSRRTAVVVVLGMLLTVVVCEASLRIWSVVDRAAALHRFHQP